MSEAYQKRYRDLLQLGADDKSALMCPAGSTVGSCQEFRIKQELFRLWAIVDEVCDKELAELNTTLDVWVKTMNSVRSESKKLAKCNVDRIQKKIEAVNKKRLGVMAAFQDTRPSFPVTPMQPMSGGRSSD